MLRQIIQSAINSGRLKFAHAQENDQLKSIGLGDKKLQNWPASASSCKNENIGGKEDSNSLNNEKDIVYELQVEDILEDDELSEIPRSTVGQPGYSQLGQEPITPAVLAKQVRPVCSTGQTGSDQGHPEKVKSECPKTNGGKDCCRHTGRKPKLSFDELLAKYLKENEAKRANRSNDVKSSRLPPKPKSRSWNWQKKNFYSAASYSPLIPSMSIPYAPHPTSFHYYSSWRWNDTWAHTPSYV